MNFYVVSPNASNNSSEEVFWKDLIQKEKVALMGWESSNKFGKMFASQVTEGDFILIAQGSNANKTLFLGGIVAGLCEEKTFPNAPRSIFYRQLREVIHKTSLDAINFDFKGAAYGDSAQIPAIYQLKPDSNPADFEIVKKLKSLIHQFKMKNENMILPLLKYKKQIILQGPPGTGKTRRSKKLASQLMAPSKISSEEILNNLTQGLVIDSSTKYTTYSVLSFTSRAVEVQLKNEGRKYLISLKDIQKAYETKLWDGGQKNGSDPYAAALAKYIFENYKSPNSKFIQFHPAYTYEDFVRGIIVETESGNPTYTSVNKIFGEMAKNAQQNYLDSLKTPEEVSRERQLESYLEEFRDEIEDKIITENGKYFLEGTTTYLFEVDKSSFRYTGDNWISSLGHRLYLNDIMILFLAEAKTRKDIKSNPKVSGSARQHSSYYLRVLQLFETYMEGKTISQTAQEKTELKKFVLIIDEINRANLPSVLGELIYGLEYRGNVIDSMYSIDGDREMVIPPNLYLIGTMNTADRSVGHIDYAIRRRFAFVDVLPSINPISNALAKEMFEKVSKLFVSNYQEVIYTQASPKRADTLMPDFRPEDVWIGHSYFLTDKKVEQEANDEIKIKMRYEVLPLLKEYVKDGILRSDDTKSNDPVQKLIQELSKL